MVAQNSRNVSNFQQTAISQMIEFCDENRNTHKNYVKVAFDKIVSNLLQYVGQKMLSISCKLNHLFSAPRRPMASRQDSGSGSVGLGPAPAPPRRR